VLPITADDLDVEVGDFLKIVTPENTYATAFGTITASSCPNSLCTIQEEDHACTIIQVSDISEEISDISIVVNAISLEGTTNSIEAVTVEKYFEDEDEYEVGFDMLHEPEPLEAGPEAWDRAYWRSDEYQAQNRYVKLDQLWSKLVPDEQNHSVSPHDFFWN